MPTLQAQIKEAMRVKGMLQVDLCRATGEKSSKISQIVNGKTKDIRLSTAVKLADALDVSLDYLAGRTEPGATSFADAETQHLADGFSQLNISGRTAIKEQLDFQLAKNAKNEAVQVDKISVVA